MNISQFNNWQLLQLDKIADVVDSLHSTPNYVSKGIPMVRVTDIKGGFLSLAEAKHVDDVVYQEFTKKRKPATGDLIISRVGSFGLVSLVKNGDLFCLGQNTALIVPKINFRYLYYCMQSQFVQRQIEQVAVGSTQKTISLASIKSLQIPVAATREIDIIAHILGSLDDKIELNQRMNDTLESIAQALYKSWFVDFDPVKSMAEGRKPEGMDDAIASLFPASFTESNRCLIPKGWVLGKLGDIANNPRTGVQPTEISPDIPYIGLEHMPRRSISLYEWEGAGKVTSTKSAMQAGDFLFGKLRPYFHKVGISPINGITSTDILIVRPKSDCFYSYLLMQISSVPFVEYTNKTSQGTKMPRTSWQDMSRYEAIFPDEKVFAAYDALVRPMFHRIVSNIHENKTLISIRDNLLPRLISGKLRVDEISETVEAVAL